MPNGGGESDMDRTILVPAAGPASGAAPPTPPAPGVDATIIRPASGTATQAPPAAIRDGIGIRVGDVLNHIFEVSRFIARGGMGEVFEGRNVNSDERVAIKVMLPSLAADPSIQDMFRKEARTLTRLSHPALVQYRVLAQEPQLGVFYIVTDFIDGADLSEVLDRLHPTTAELIALTRRLAEGLRVAHGLGAIHRDIAPDNVRLENGLLAQARIIDFGIAKDTSPGAKTIVGDGFAGKLGYVAPEQLGDFGAEVGPWSDVYSLGLVMLAVATGRNPDLSGSFVEAIEKRRKGPDLTGAPVELHGLFAAMLEADPTARLRSMDAVLERLDAPLPAQVAISPTRTPHDPARFKDRSITDRRLWWIGGGAAGFALLAGLGYIALGGGTPKPRPVQPVIVAGGMATGTAASDPVATARVVVTRALPGVPCSWLDMVDARRDGRGVTVGLAGAVGNPPSAASALSRAATAAGVQLAETDLSEVAPVEQAECQSIDAFRAIRGAGAAHISVPQRKFEMTKLTSGDFAGQVGATVVVQLDLNGLQDFALYGVDPTGEISSVIPSRKYFEALPKGGQITALGDNRYRIQTDSNHAGWSGLVLLSGNGGFSDSLMVAKPGQHGADWPQRFAKAARADGWKAEMVWMKAVDEIPNG